MCVRVCMRACVCAYKRACVCTCGNLSLCVCMCVCFNVFFMSTLFLILDRTKENPLYSPSTPNRSHKSPQTDVLGSDVAESTLQAVRRGEVVGVEEWHPHKDTPSKGPYCNYHV